MKQIALDKMFLSPKLLMTALVLLTLSVFSMLATAAQPASAEAVAAPQQFNHMATGFPLSGAHVIAECGSCHTGGVFKGTPRNCSGCHAKGRRVVATAMSANHIVTSEQCEVCHTSTATFLGARYNHGKAAPGSCTTCHNGLAATGKPANHGGARSVNCEKCHKTVAWLPAGFNHAGVGVGTCKTCHGVSATGKPTNHVSPTSQSSCDTCHRTTAWAPTSYSHTGGTCTNCHAVGLTPEKNRQTPGTHTAGLKLTGSCDTCHPRTTSWLPAGFNHAGQAPGSCLTCHNGISATGKPASHTGARATQVCDACHKTVAWLPAGFDHTGVVSGCSTCHGAQKAPTHIPYLTGTDCGVCHIPPVGFAGGSFATKRITGSLLHTYLPTTCVSCHAPSSPYTGGQRKMGSHEGFNGSSPDCSSSGCHKPAGRKGTAYIKWD